MKKKEKLIIHETDCHGCGYYCYNGTVEHYVYDDTPGDIRAAVEALIEIGFIDEDDVKIIEGEEIYGMLKEEE